MMSSHTTGQQHMAWGYCTTALAMNGSGKKLQQTQLHSQQCCKTKHLLPSLINTSGSHITRNTYPAQYLATKVPHTLQHSIATNSRTVAAVISSSLTLPNASTSRRNMHRYARMHETCMRLSQQTDDLLPQDFQTLSPPTHIWVQSQYTRHQ